MKELKKDSIVVSWVLIGILVLLTAVISVIFYFASIKLNEQTIATSHAKIDNELEETEIIKLKSLQTYLNQNKSTVERAADVVSESQSYTYQNQGISDLNTFANRTGVSIMAIDFPTPKQTPAKGEVVISGVKKIPMVVRLDGPVDFVRVLQFIKQIEQNLTKMQITSVALTPDTEKPNLLASPTLNIEVFVR